MLIAVLLCGMTGCYDDKGEFSGYDKTQEQGTVSFAQPDDTEADKPTREQSSDTQGDETTADNDLTQSTPEETEPETPEQTEPAMVFVPVEETVYATDHLNIRTEPSTTATIYRTMYTGEPARRTGISDEWSRILYNGEEYYVSSAYLSTEPVVAENLSDRVDQLLRQMTVASETDQLVLAVGQNDGGDRCTVYYYTKDSQGNWNKHFETPGFWGFNGVKKVILEADGCTPIGCFPFRFAYGINDDPGSVMEYKKATPTAYMVDDVNSQYYNLWVDTEDPGVVQDWKTAEHVIDFPTSYNYGLFIDNNPDCDPTQGSSVICIHCNSPRGFSPGCINIAQEHILTLVTELDYSSRIVIVYGVEDLIEY
jgi:L,D-peptidoglycan transpeptidase YkuD (ErfK/YbiS/YcfS/YnhG family)